MARVFARSSLKNSQGQQNIQSSKQLPNFRMDKKPELLFAEKGIPLSPFFKLEMSKEIPAC